jgi:hypothetical protein
MLPLFALVQRWMYMSLNLEVSVLVLLSFIWLISYDRMYCCLTAEWLAVWTDKLKQGWKERFYGFD